MYWSHYDAFVVFIMVNKKYKTDKYIIIAKKVMPPHYREIIAKSGVLSVDQLLRTASQSLCPRINSRPASLRTLFLRMVVYLQRLCLCLSEK